MATETMLVENHIRQTLASDATLVGLLGTAKIYNELAPPNTTGPYIVFRYQSSRDIRGNGAVRTATTLTYLVEVISRENQSFGDIAPIAERMDTSLHDSSGTVTGGRVLGVTRLNPFKLLEPQTDGTFIKRLGGIYRLDAQRI